MILLIDNYDSFSYNLYHLVGRQNPMIRVVRNDAVTVEEIKEMGPQALLLSPGPGKPIGAGICIEAVQRLSASIPILGVCLGHQVICEAFGGTVSYAKELMHGKASQISLDTGSRMFYGMKKEITAARYHSLAAVKECLPGCLKVTAQTAQGEVMAVEHNKYPVFGLQFHPESILTPDGYQMIQNFLKAAEHFRTQNTE